MIKWSGIASWMSSLHKTKTITTLNALNPFLSTDFSIYIKSIIRIWMVSKFSYNRRKKKQSVCVLENNKIHITYVLRVLLQYQSDVWDQCVMLLYMVNENINLHSALDNWFSDLDNFGLHKYSLKHHWLDHSFKQVRKTYNRIIWKCENFYVKTDFICDCILLHCYVLKFYHINWCL